MTYGSLGDRAKVSVIVALHNRLAQFEHCLASLARQDYPMKDVELLICDDGSSEDVEPLTERFVGVFGGLQVLYLVRRQGPCAARNMGIRASKADVCVIVDSDLVCAPDFLSRIMQAFAEHPDWVAVQAAVIPTGGEVSPLWEAPINDRGISYLAGGSAYRKAPLFLVGGFDEEFHSMCCEDAEIAARLLPLGRFGFVPDAVAYHPRRRVTLATHWRWRLHWKFLVILGKRYGINGFPGRSIGPLPTRLRIMLSALVRTPGKRFLQGIKHTRVNLVEGLIAMGYAVFDVFCGILVLPEIFFAKVPPRRDYLSASPPADGLVH